MSNPYPLTTFTKKESTLNHSQDKKQTPSSSQNTLSKSAADAMTVSQIKQRCKVSTALLKKHTDASLLPDTTADAPKAALDDLGQLRAIHALQTAFDIHAQGYHVFAVGENGLGKRTFITNYLQQHGHKQSAINDWVYVHNFYDPRCPLAIALKPAQAPILQKSLIDIWNKLTKSLSELSQSVVSQTEKMPSNTASLDVHLDELYQQCAHDCLKDCFYSLFSQYSDNKKLADYLTAVQQDMTYHAATIAAGTDMRFLVDNLRLIPDRYYVNVIATDHHSAGLDSFEHTLSSESNYDAQNKQQVVRTRRDAKKTSDGAPILFEPYPKLSNLLGAIGTSSQAGSSVSNHAMIQPGALHQANGGYLIIEAGHLAEHKEAWQALKRTLQSRIIELSNYRQSDAIGGLPLYPEPIPLNLKVILLGEPDLYDQFAELDAEFNTTFKIRADFHDEVARTVDNEIAMSSKMADIIDKYKLHHFDSNAQAILLEHLSLQSEDQNKLSLHTDRMIQLMLEANRHAINGQTGLVGDAHVKQALSDMSYRSSYLQELYLQEITDGQQLINTSGSAVGQINALTIVDYADSEFGMPALLTAVVQHSTGSGDILDIERDVELGGSLHAKGMLIMNSYLRALFSPYHPLNFTASLAFEQSYAHIDGDSATLSEACALLSALADIPISQSLAITGSMNQLGRVQAVGGVNAKVAGFFDACSHQGFTGEQGVILPYANISQLMLRDDIIEQVNAGNFHIYGVKTLSEALTILSGMPVDSINKKGRYRKSTLFGKIIKNLKKWEEQLNPPETDDLDEEPINESGSDQTSHNDKKG